MARYVAALCTHLQRSASSKTVPDAAWKQSAAELQPWAAATISDVAGPLRRASLPPTVFLGGGTPTALPLPLLEQIMQTIDPIIPLNQAEVTSEANPGTVLGDSYLRAMHAMGINRISMGVQSLHDPTLRVLGRIHTAAEARASYTTARRVGFENINLDFIFGLPGQDVAQWEASLHELIRWEIDHLALYSLIVEPGTPLQSQVAAGRVVVPNDDTTAEMYERAIDILGSAGYIQYEISNWARPGRAGLPATHSLPAYASRHNVAYWLDADYLGVGAGAHSHSRRWRWADERVLEQFTGRVERHEPPLSECTLLTQADVEAETMMMGLRLTTGVGNIHFEERCGRSLEAAFGTTLNELVGLALIEQDAAGVRLTSRGRMIGNTVFARFLA